MSLLISFIGLLACLFGFFDMDLTVFAVGVFFLVMGLAWACTDFRSNDFYRGKL